MRKSLLLLTVVLTGWASAQGAPVKYSLQGQPFTIFEGEFSGQGAQPTAISAWFVMADAIATGSGYVDLSFSDGTPPSPALLDFSYSDGLTDYTLASLLAAPEHFVILRLWIDELGEVPYWVTRVSTGHEHVPYKSWLLEDGYWEGPAKAAAPGYNDNSLGDGSGTSYCNPTPSVYGCFDDSYARTTFNPVTGRYDYDGPGAWTIAIVPVPPAVWLFGSALGVMGWMRRRGVRVLPRFHGNEVLQRVSER